MRRWLPVTVAFLLLAAAGGSVWAATRRGYPGVVYYQQVTSQMRESTGLVSGATGHTEQWLDPARRLVRERDSGLLMILRDGRLYTASDRQPLDDEPAPAALQREYARQYDGLRAGGFGALGAALRARALGPVMRVQFEGRAALRFDTPDHAAGVSSATIWLDADTLEPLARRLVSGASGVSVEQRMRNLRRIPAGTLPADFFDRPRDRRGWWAGLQGWLGDHVGGR